MPSAFGSKSERAALKPFMDELQHVATKADARETAEDRPPSPAIGEGDPASPDADGDGEAEEQSSASLASIGSLLEAGEVAAREGVSTLELFLAELNPHASSLITSEMRVRWVNIATGQTK